MWNRMICRLFGPPYFEDIRQTHMAQLLHLVLWSLIVVVIITTIVGAVTLPETYLRWTLLSIIVIAANLALLGLNRRGHTRIASTVLLVSLWCIVSVMTFTAGGIHAPDMEGFVVIVLLAGPLLGARGAIVT